MNVFGRRREEKPAAPDPQPATDHAAPPQPAQGLPARGASRDPSMSLPPKTNVGAPMAPATTAIPPRPSALSASGGLPANAAPPAAMPAPKPNGPDRRTLVVGRGISLQGTVADAERLVVEGTVESEMIQATELAISQTGSFKGAVEVEDAEVAGVFEGTLTARGALVLRGTGRVLGVARCRRLMVEDGGQVSAKIEMLTDTPIAVPALPRPALAEG